MTATWRQLGISVVEVPSTAAEADELLHAAEEDPDTSGIVVVFSDDSVADASQPSAVATGWRGKPLVGILDGRIRSGALQFACSCDSRVATEGATLATSDLEPASVTVLVDLLGRSRAAELIASASHTIAYQRLGLVNATVAAPERFHEAARQVRRLDALGPAGLAVLRGSNATGSPVPEPSTEGADDAGTSDDGPPTGVTPRATRKRQQILDAAAKVLSDQGYHGCRLSDIAALCGRNQASIYYYFDSKEVLVEEVLRTGITHAFDRVRSEVDALPAEATALDRLLTAMRAHLAVALGASDYGAATIRLTGQLPVDIGERTRRLQRSYGRYWSSLFEKARDDGFLRADMDLSVVRAFVAGALNYAIEWYVPEKLTVDALADEALTLFVSGMLRPDAPVE